MGSFMSSGPQLPKPIQHSDLENHLESAIQQYRKDCREIGFAVIEMNETFMNECMEYRSVISEWMKKNKFEEKLKYEAEFKNEILKELGHKPNIGYIVTEKKKEYLKFKQNSKVTFPNQQIYDQFFKLLPLFQSLNELSIEILLSETVEDPKTHNEIPLATAEVRGQLKKFSQIHSSISLIHYFNKKYDEVYEDEEVDEYNTPKTKSEKEKEQTTETADHKNDEQHVTQEKTKKEKQDNEKYDIETQISNRTVETPLGKHVDTGLLTFILCSDIRGLDLLDRKTNQYFPPEQYYSPNKHVFVIAGKKMEVFSDLKLIESTWHQVTIPVTSERYSLLYFVDIQKDD